MGKLRKNVKTTFKKKDKKGQKFTNWGNNCTEVRKSVRLNPDLHKKVSSVGAAGAQPSQERT